MSLTAHDIAARVRGRRTADGMTQAELAALAGVSRNWIVAIETGRANASLDVILRVLDALDLQIEFVDVPTEGGPTRPGDMIDLDAVVEGRHR